MLYRPVLIATLLTMMLVGSASAQYRAEQGSEWSFNAPKVEPGQPPELVRLAPVETHTLGRSLGSTLLGSVAGAAATLAYFAVRDEDTYECNACVEKALVAGLTTLTSTAVGAQVAGASTPRSVAASFAGTVLGAAIGLALIEPLSAGWPAGVIGFTVGQGLIAGMIAHGGVE